MAVFKSLRRWISDYDAYGLLGLYGMHLLSTEQFRTLLDSVARTRLLDVGAGNGAITECVRPLFERVVVTETSRVMRHRLRRRGLSVGRSDLSDAVALGGQRFDVVCALNVLDRTARPRGLLREMKRVLQPQGRLLLSVPLPLRPHVDRGAETVDPDEPMPDCSGAFEPALGRLVEELIEPAGLRVERLSRAPYLSRGDRHHPLIVLDDAILLCRATPT